MLNAKQNGPDETLNFTVTSKEVVLGLRPVSRLGRSTERPLSWYNNSMLYLIGCISKNWGIGYKNQLLFHYPGDMEFFKRQTMGNTVVMGRKTYESLMRPLEGRRNVIMTRNPDYRGGNGCEVIHSVAEFYELQKTMRPGKDIYIIGGAELYKMFIDEADAIYLTEVNKMKPADAFFPQFEKSDYIVHTKSVHPDYKIVKYIKRH